MDEQRLDWNDFRLVLAIAQGGSLTAAAKALGVSHPTVFRHARDLEAKLGVQVFKRDRSGYALTEAGEDIRSVAARIDADVNGLQRRIAGRDNRAAGQIRVAVVDTLLGGPLMPVLKTFQESQPGILLDIMVGISMADLSKREADVALRAGGVPPQSLVGRKLCKIAVAIYQANSREPVDLDRLDTYPWLVPDASLAHLASAEWLKQRGLERAAVLRANSLMTLCAATAYDVGIAILPCYVADLQPNLRRVGSPIEALAGDLWLLMHPELRKVARIKAFAAHIHQHFQKLKPLFEGRM